MFAVIDLETTGGNINSERIIEIGIVLHDGKHKIGEYTTLINPEKEISGFISTFTGITNAMVKHAPKFVDVADTILELLEGKVIVAHNARFDYNFIKSEFRRINIPFIKKHICTVQLSKKIFPKIKSYSLGNICKDLGIDIDNRHRAFGDAAATALLLEQLIANDTNKIIKELLTDDIKKLYLPKNIPHKTGINNSFFNIMAIVAITPPSINEPVSPIKTVAGKALYHKNPIHAPIKAAQTTTTSPEFGMYNTFR